jgi:hypothetical protein
MTEGDTSCQSIRWSACVGLSDNKRSSDIDNVNYSEGQRCKSFYLFATSLPTRSITPPPPLCDDSDTSVAYECESKRELMSRYGEKADESGRISSSNVSYPSVAPTTQLH